MEPLTTAERAELAELAGRFAKALAHHDDGLPQGFDGCACSCHRTGASHIIACCGPAQTSDAIADEPQTLGAPRTTYLYYFPENLRIEEDILP